MIAAVDIGATYTRVAMFEGDSLINKTTFETAKHFEREITDIAEVILDWNQKPEKVVAGIPGDLDRSSGTIINAVNLPDWRGRNFVKSLTAKIGISVKIEHDVVLAAHGEAEQSDTFPFLYISWGSGFSGAYVRKFGNSHDVVSLELGHQVLVPDGPLCACGQRGCAEVYLGGASAEKTYGKSFAEADENVWGAVSQKAAHALTNAVNLFPVSKIVFGGGVVNKHPGILKMCQESLEQMLKGYAVPELSIAARGEDSVLWGANVLAKLSKD